MAVTLVTSHGELPIRLEWRQAPRTARNFIELCRSGYYDGCLVHRVVPGFTAQTGDPLGDGSGGESIYGSVFDDEISARLSHAEAGVVSMANAGRNSNGSQFFVTLGAAQHLDGKHTVFGAVDSAAGREVLDDIAGAKLDSKNRPMDEIKIFTALIRENPWEGEPLPDGAALPEKPLVADKKGVCNQQ